MHPTPHNLHARCGRLRLLIATLVCGALSGCFVVDALAPAPSKPKRRDALPPGDLPPLPLAPGPKPLTPPRLARRIALDLGLSLPSATDVDTLVADTDQIALVVDTHLASTTSSLAIASLQPRAWGLSETRIAALDGFIDAGDATLGQTLTAALRRRLVEEPVQSLRFVLDNNRPFSALFTAGFSVMHTSAATFWDQAVDGAPWPGESYRFAPFQGGRPAVGLLASFSLLAAHPAADGEQLPRANALLRELTCTSLSDPKAHLFYKLNGAKLRSDLSALALTEKACAGCHAQMHGLAVGLQGLGEGADLEEFVTYTAPNTAPEDFYAGAPYAGVDDLGVKIGNDPRLHRCEVEKLIAALYQRPFGARDRRAAALALDEFYAGDQDLKAAVRRIALDPEFSIAPLDTTIKGDTTYQSSGVRLLKRAQWRHLIEDMVPGTTTIDYPDELDPGSEELLTDVWMMPSGNYWHAVDRIARQAATAIVATELADEALAVNRRLLKELPDGDASGADLLTVSTQIRAAWRRITGEELVDSSPIFSALQGLWGDLEAGDDAESVRQAWRTMLVAILTHPNVVTY